jgi:excisionase family DNA binding protein
VTDKLLLDLNDVAQSLSISRRLVQQLLYDGALPSVLVGRRRLIARADLDAFVERLRVERVHAELMRDGRPAIVALEARRPDTCGPPRSRQEVKRASLARRQPA